MHLHNFDNYEQNWRMYGGRSGQKIGITYEGENYLLKFPQNLKVRQMKNTVLSYSNSPVCEYIDSHIYAILGYDVHETLLGTRNGKTVVACKDFLQPGDRLYEFEKILVTNETPSLTSGSSSTEHGADLREVIDTIKTHPRLAEVPGLMEHFWDMFVVDALIGNPDRNNGNWGIVVCADGGAEISPVYDNGNCLNAKWDDEKIKSVMADDEKFKTEAWNGRRCIFEVDGKAINPYHLILGKEYENCTEAVRRNVPKIRKSLPQIEALIDGIFVLSQTQKDFYNAVIRARFEEVLVQVL
ncbi:MAG: CtkA family protein [Clostridiales bacterium]|nr:CtkA family protein [Clostridiales bacterium]